MKKILCGALIASMAIGLIGCSGSTGKQKGESEHESGDHSITVWAWDKNMNGASIEEAKKLYGDDIEVNFVEMGKADVLTKLHTVLASGVTEDLPDIVLISDLNAKGYLMSYPDSFVAMDDVINYDDFASYKVAAVSEGGHGYGVPFDAGVAGLFYRTDYLAEIGYDEEKMSQLTWDEYLSLGDKLKEKGHLLQTFNPNDISDFQIMLQSTGKWFTEKDGKADFKDNAALKECYDIFKTMNESDYVKMVNDWNGFAGAINGGDVACVIRGAWIVATIGQEQSQSGKWAVAPVPKMSTPDAVQYSNQGGSSWFVLKNAKNADLATDFLKKTFGENKDLYNTLLKEKNILGTYIPASDVDGYEQASEFFGGQKVNKLLSEWLEKIPAVDTGAYTAEAMAALLSVTPDILSGADLTEAFDKASEQFEQATR